MMDRFENIGRPKSMVWPHKHSFYEILWIAEGSSKHKIDQYAFDLPGDSLFFIAPGQVHELDHLEAVKGYSIMFTEAFLALSRAKPETFLHLAFLENSHQQPSLLLSPGESIEMKPLLELLHRESGKEDRSPELIRHLLMAFLLSIQRIFDDTNPAEEVGNLNVEVFKKFKKLIEVHYKQESRLPFFAEKLFITPHHLNEITKKVTGKTAGELIRERILIEAKRMLIHGHWPVGQIAADLGFKDFSYFSRQFKKQEGISPVDFRKNNPSHAV